MQAEPDADHRRRHADRVGAAVALAIGTTLYCRGCTRGKDAEHVTLGPMVSDRLAGLVVAGVWP
jgi:hypothetical protein